MVNEDSMAEDKREVREGEELGLGLWVRASIRLGLGLGAVDLGEKRVIERRSIWKKWVMAVGRSRV